MRSRLPGLAILILVSGACEKKESKREPPSAPASPSPTASPTAAASPSPSAGADASAPAGLPDSANPGINDRYDTPEGRAAAIKIFEGSERGAFQQPADVVKLLGLKPGDVVADVGAGSGYMTADLSHAVGPKGKVYAEDITAPFLDEVRAKIEKEKLTNIEVILGTETDAKLPDACCDVVLVLDTYHHFEWPEPMLASLKKALKPNGRLVIVDFHRRSNPMFEGLKIDYEKHIRLTADEVVAQIEKLGWKRLEMKDFPPYQYVAVFTPGS